MRWPAHNKVETDICKRFAYFPVKCHTEWVWWEQYYRLYFMTEHGLHCTQDMSLDEWDSRKTRQQRENERGR